MHVVLCNERLLFRFGLDRALILMGRRLHEAGHRITVLVSRFDADSVEGWADQVHVIPEAVDYIRSNESATDYLAAQWDDWFQSENLPDLAVIGGWPFFSAIGLFEDQGVATLFLDCGAVPTEGYDGGALLVQEKLRDMRRQFLPRTSHIASISEFITRSQSRIDSDRRVPISTVLLGADHMEDAVWSGGANGDRAYLRDRVANVLADQGPAILCLGRWEPQSYKNSHAVFDIIDGVTKEFPHAKALILADPKTADIPRRYRGRVIPIGFPDDGQLQDLMKRVDLGMVHSLWEGFGLPLAEMQWLRRPVLAFEIGAHPEVAVDPKVLCDSDGSMIDKACAILRGDPESQVPAEAYERFERKFRWDRVLQEWQELIDQILSEKRPTHLILDVTCAAIDPANTGVIRVTRQLARALQSQTDVSFVRWDEGAQAYVFPNAAEYEQLSQFNGPACPKNAVISPRGRRIRLDEQLRRFSDESTWLCLTETVRASVLTTAQAFAHDHGWRVAAIFYDAIPILHPEFVQDTLVRENHASYMRELSGCDVVVPISSFSAQCLEDFWRDHGTPETPVEVDLLAGQLGAQVPEHGSDEILAVEGRATRMLCVSTVEPRKNHLRLIEACLTLKRRRPGLRWQLDLVGNRYAGGEELADQVNAACKKHPEIRWLGVVDDETLIDLYSKADFTVYPSLIEGFGVPIVESLAFGKPCLCADSGVMAELAADGGCVTANVQSVDALSDRIERLICDSELLGDLSEQARSRPVRTWDEYARNFTMILAQQTGRLNTEAVDQVFPFPGGDGKHQAADSESMPFDLDQALYPQCLCEHWQMDHAERMTLRALLEHVKPRCAIEVGTRRGGSLSLMAQHALVVFSIDKAPMPPSVRVFPNASLLTGPSELLLPALFDELSQQDMDPQLVLINGGDSSEGVGRDLQAILQHSPRAPLWVVMHHSMNPVCRTGMLSVDWSANPHVHFVDLDFVPGRLAKHDGGGAGEIWGGLGLARLLPQIRQGSLHVGQSTRRMMETLAAPQPADVSSETHLVSSGAHLSKSL